VPKLKSVRFLNRQEQGYFFLSRCQALERDQRPWQPAFEWRSRKAGVVNDHVTCGNICPWVWKSASRTVTSRAVSRTMSGNNDRPATRGTEFNPMCFTSFENGKCLALRSNFEKFPSHEKLKKKRFWRKRQTSSPNCSAAAGSTELFELYSFISLFYIFETTGHPS